MIAATLPQSRPFVLPLSLLAILAVALAAWTAAPAEPRASELVETIKAVKPSVVAVGTYQRTRRPAARVKGTGFAVHDGLLIVTNAHVVNGRLDQENREQLAVFGGTGDKVETRFAELLSKDREHDVAILRITGPPLPVLSLAEDDMLEEGRLVAFTGYPIGQVLGLFPVTHRGIVSAISPFAIPQQSPRQLDAKMIRHLRNRFSVFQLDAVAYPGNSGSPLYDISTGRVHGIVNSVFVKDTKENLLKDPSGITYAIPIRYAKALLEKAGLTN